MLEQAITTVIEQSEERNAMREGDYIRDGLVYCGVCHSPRQMLFPLNSKLVWKMCKHEEEADEAQKHQDRAKKLRAACFSDIAMHSHTFENADEEGKSTIDRAKCYVDNFNKYRTRGIGVVFYGGVGNGKSFAAACIANALIDKGVYCCMTDLLTINREWNADIKRRSDLIDRLKSYDLLIIDDLGIERKSESMYEMVYTIINERLKTKRPNIITTNLTVDELVSPQEAATERIYSRLYEMSIPIHCNGADRRKNKMIDNIAEFEKDYAQSRAKQE